MDPDLYETTGDSEAQCVQRTATSPEQRVEGTARRSARIGSCAVSEEMRNYLAQCIRN